MTAERAGKVLRSSLEFDEKHPIYVDGLQRTAKERARVYAHIEITADASPLEAAALVRRRFDTPGFRSLPLNPFSDLGSYPAYVLTGFAESLPCIPRPELETLLSKLAACQRR